jgi:hypothetical protein
VFPGILDRRSQLSQPQCLARIEFQKVDCLGDIRIRLDPILAHLVRQPRAELKLAFTNQLRRLQQQRSALFYCDKLPRRERLQGSPHRALGVFEPRLLVHAHYLCRPRRIDRFNLARGARPLRADHQFILVAEHISHPDERSLHRMHIFRIVEINERFVAKFSAGRNRLDDSADLGS